MRLDKAAAAVSITPSILASFPEPVFLPGYECLEGASRTSQGRKNSSYTTSAWSQPWNQKIGRTVSESQGCYMHSYIWGYVLGIDSLVPSNSLPGHAYDVANISLVLEKPFEGLFCWWSPTSHQYRDWKAWICFRHSQLENCHWAQDHFRHRHISHPSVLCVGPLGDFTSEVEEADQHLELEAADIHVTILHRKNIEYLHDVWEEFRLIFNWIFPGGTLWQKCIWNTCGASWQKARRAEVRQLRIWWLLSRNIRTWDRESTLRSWEALTRVGIGVETKGWYETYSRSRGVWGQKVRVDWKRARCGWGRTQSKWGVH